MKKISSNQKPFLHLAVVITLSLLFLGINVRKAESSTTADAMEAARCNATRISDCLPDDEEFLMESETSRRILQAKNKKMIRYGPLRTQQVCHGNVYGDCMGAGKIHTKRPCNYQNTCNRQVSHG